jgi:hypothetical protein
LSTFAGNRKGQVMTDRLASTPISQARAVDVNRRDAS